MPSTAAAPKKTEKPAIAKAQLKTLPVGELRESKLNPRTIYDENELKNLAESMKTDGVIEPLVVREIANGKGASYEILAGSRRFRAAKLAGLKEIPCSIRDCSDEAAMRLAIVENIQRQNLSPLEEAEGYRRLIEEAKVEVKEIAAEIGKSIGYVYAMLKLLDLAPATKDALAAKRIEWGHGVRLARLSESLQKEFLNRILQHGMSVRDLEREIQYVHRNLSAAPWKLEDAELVPTAGPCTTCPHRSTKELHPDLKPNTCLRPDCYEAKLIATAEREAYNQAVKLAKGKKDEKSLKAEAIKLYDSTRGGKPEPGAAYADPYGLDKNSPMWREAGDKFCDATKMGVVMEGNGHYSHLTGKRLDYGAMLPVCLNRECAVHAPKTASGRVKKSEAELKRERKKREEERLEAAFRKAILDAILVKAKATPWNRMHSELVFVAVETFRRLWGNYKGPFLRRHGLEPAKLSKYGGLDHERPFQKMAANMEENELRALLIELALTASIDGADYDGTDRLKNAAKRWKLDLAKIKSETAKRLKSK